MDRDDWVLIAMLVIVLVVEVTDRYMLRLPY